jgi:hypothetical protein
VGKGQALPEKTYWRVVVGRDISDVLIVDVEADAEAVNRYESVCGEQV